MGKEYIERKKIEEMLENAQLISEGEYCGYCTEDINLNRITSADVTEVVRCKDCKYWTGINEFGDGECGHLMGLHDVAQPGDFCSYGKRI